MRRCNAGIITKVAIQCAPLLPCNATAFMAVPSFEHAQQAHHLARKHFAQTLSAFEFLDQASVDLVLQHVPGTERPFARSHPMYVMIELAGAYLCNVGAPSLLQAIALHAAVELCNQSNKELPCPSRANACCQAEDQYWKG
jgi:FAD linked oxidases, C-terminal domain